MEICPLRLRIADPQTSVSHRVNGTSKCVKGQQLQFVFFAKEDSSVVANEGQICLP